MTEMQWKKWIESLQAFGWDFERICIFVQSCMKKFETKDHLYCENTNVFTQWLFQGTCYLWIKAMNCGGGHTQGSEKVDSLQIHSGPNGAKGNWDWSGKVWNVMLREEKILSRGKKLIKLKIVDLKTILSKIQLHDMTRNNSHTSTSTNPRDRVKTQKPNPILKKSPSDWN